MSYLSNFALYFPFFLIPLLVVPGMEDAFILPKTALAFVFAPLALYFSLRGRKILALPPWYCILFMIWLLIGGQLAENSTLAFYDIIFAGAFFLFICAFLNCGEEKRFIMGKIAIISSLLAATYSFFQYFGFDPFINYETRVSLGLKRLYSTLGNKNFLSEYLLACLPLILWIYGFYNEKKSVAKNIILAIFSVFLLLLSIFLIFSRGVIIALFLGSLCLFSIYFRERGQRNLALPFLSAILLILLVFSLYYHRNFQSAHREFNDLATPYRNSLEQRLHIWRIAWDMAKIRPLTGLGPGSFRWLFFENQAPYLKDFRWLPLFCRAEMAHFEFLQLFVESGLIGLLLVLYGLYDTAKGIWSRLFSPSILGPALSFFLLLICSLFAFPFRLPATALLCCLCLAQLWARGNSVMLVDLDMPDGLNYAFFRRIFLNITMFLILCAYSIYGMAMLVSGWNMGMGLIFRDSGFFNEAQSRFLTASLWDFTAGQAHYELGRLFQQKGENYAALSQFNQSAKTFNQPCLFENRSRVHWQLGDFQSAVIDGERAFYLNPGSLRGAHLLMKLYENQSELNKARQLKAWLSILEKNPGLY